MPPFLRFAAACALTLPATGALGADLSIEVRGELTDEGQIGCALHSQAGTFPMLEPAQAYWVPAKAEGVVCVFPGLASGTYAVAVSHDLNGNSKTDTNFFGMPTEAWGVSNGARPTLRAPRFEEAAFEVTTGQAVMLLIEVAR